MLKNKKILIVGAGGFIGGHLIKKLLDGKNSLVACDIKPKKSIGFKIMMMLKIIILWI